MSRTVAVRELRAGLAEFLDQVATQREHLVVTRHGRPAAAVIPIDEYEALEETTAVLSDQSALRAIEEGLADLAADRTHSLDEVRSEFASRKRA